MTKRGAGGLLRKSSGRPRNLLGDPKATPDSQLGTLGESVLAALSVTSITGLINPSYMDLRYRSVDPGMKAEAKTALNYSLLASLAASVVIGWGFRNAIPGIVGGVSSLVVYALYVHALEAGPPVPPKTVQ